MTDYLKEAQELFDYTQKLRRDFHQHPELGFQEFRTASIVARELQDLGLEVTTGVGKTGVVAMLEGQRPGPVVLLRFDMDALPIQEETGAEYASQNPGVMHACGHDGHTAIGLTVARLLHAHRKELCGAVKLVFQPAEEGLGGAESMVAAGVLQDPRPDFSLALHLWNEFPLGMISIAPGGVMAAADIFKIRINGRGGHGAIPHLAVDTILASSQVVASLQSIVARSVSPLESAVISVTSIHGGETFNIIPSQVELSGTIRTFDPQVREGVIRRFYEIVQGTAQSHGCQAEIDLQVITPAVINDPDLAAHVQRVASQVLPEHQIDRAYRTMGSEDMAFMMQDIPGCYFFIGSSNSARGLDAGHHQPRFDFDEQAMPQAAAVMTAAAVQLLAGERPMEGGGQ
ncbi:MAG: amidohydrolase [Chloroflexi bacterium]|nr:amidohydrolase [Chloroflexota bacterium]